MLAGQRLIRYFGNLFTLEPLNLVAAFVNDSLFYAFVAVARLGVCLISRRSLKRRPS
jgi:hypothetical protein